MKNKFNVKIDAKTVWGLVGLGASLIGLIAGQKNDKFKEETLTNDAAEKAAEMVMAKLSSKND